MDFLPWSTFTRIVARYGGDARVRTLCCAEQYRAMAFAQLTYRESLRDIEVCLSAQASKLYHMGFREPVRRSTYPSAEGRLPESLHFAESDVILGVVRARSVHKIGYGPNCDWAAA